MKPASSMWIGPSGLCLSFGCETWGLGLSRQGAEGAHCQTQAPLSNVNCDLDITTFPSPKAGTTTIEGQPGGPQKPIQQLSTPDEKNFRRSPVCLLKAPLEPITPGFSLPHPRAPASKGTINQSRTRPLAGPSFTPIPRRRAVGPICPQREASQRAALHH